MTVVDEHFQARTLVNAVRHCADLKISDAVVEDVINALTRILSDACLDGHTVVVESRRNLDMVR